MSHIAMPCTCMCIEHPTVGGLVYRVIETGQPGAEQSKVKYCRGTNSDDGEPPF